MNADVLAQMRARFTRLLESQDQRVTPLRRTFVAALLAAGNSLAAIFTERLSPETWVTNVDFMITCHPLPDAFFFYCEFNHHNHCSAVVEQGRVAFLGYFEQELSRRCTDPRATAIELADAVYGAMALPFVLCNFRRRLRIPAELIDYIYREFI
jgi:hypothetical protein